MFYSEYVLAKKGPLGQFWLAAHWSKKLTRAQISKSDVKEACQAIMTPKAPLALRTSGHLLLGVVRIHDSKQKALMNDCSDAFVKIKLAFRPGNVDLSEPQAALHQITLAEGDLQILDFDAADLELDLDLPEAMATQTHRGAITMQEADFGLYDDDLFQHGDWQPEVLRDDSRSMTRSSLGLGAGMDADVTGTTVAGAADGLSFAYEQEEDLQASKSLLAGTSQIEDMQPEIDRPLEDFDISLPEEPPLDQFDPLPPPPAAEEALQIELGEGELEALPAKPTTARDTSRKARVSKKRQLIVDDINEIPGKVIREGLSEHGPDDITRAPFNPERGAFQFDPIPRTLRAMKRLRLSEETASIIRRPLLQGMSQSVTDVLEGGIPDWLDDDEEEAGMVQQPEEDLLLPPEQYEDPLLPLEDEYVEPEPPMDAPLLEEAAQTPQPLDERSFDVTHDGGADPNETSFLNMTDMGEEQQVTKSDFQAAGWTARTQTMIGNLDAAFSKVGAHGEPSLSFNEMTGSSARLVRAACFFELLVLKTRDYIEVEQEEPFGDIVVTPTDSFQAAVLETQA